MVDRLFDTAVLIIGVGRHQDRVTIQRKADGQSRLSAMTPSFTGPPGLRLLA